MVRKDGMCCTCRVVPALTHGYCSPCKRVRKDQLHTPEREADERAYQRAYGFQKRYGITEPERDALVEAQDHRCAICRVHESVGGGKGGKFDVDHDHDTGLVRGMLCRNCNTGLGRFKDDPEQLRAALNYLERVTPSLSPTRRA